MQGGFVVSATWNNETDEVSGVSIVSDAGRHCALLSPWPRATGPGAVLVRARRPDGGPAAGVEVTWRSDDPRGAILAWETDAGSIYVVTPAP